MFTVLPTPLMKNIAFSASQLEYRPLESCLALSLLLAVEQAAIACAPTRGRRDAALADRVAVAALRPALNCIPMRGRIVIGEGERDEAPMLYIGETLGTGVGPEIDIAVDPLEGTNLCASNAAGAITVLAASERGGLLHAPDCYMEKIMAGPACRGVLDLDAPVRDNLAAIGRRLGLGISELEITVLDRPRHAMLIGAIQAVGARVRLIRDGDLAAAIATALPDSGVHAVMGIGGAPEGVLAAAALRCLGGEVLGRLVADTSAIRERLGSMGVADPGRIYQADDLASGREIVFAACGVTEGGLLRGVRQSQNKVRTHALLVSSPARRIRFIECDHTA